ncbi:MAG: hypothetical protein CMO74_03780 [Verrucomicrobiales bacterium]|nr:hypothetical protein [Verrucomicrobiales bacterium]
MKQLAILAGCLAGAAWLAAAPPAAGAAGDPNRVTVIGAVDESKLVPLALQGFSGEVAAVLRFDLEVQGFKIVPPDNAKYILSGKNGAAVEGALQDANQDFLFNKSFNGGSLRSQAHALSDAVVESVHRIPGIGQTKIIFTRKTGARSWEVFQSDFDGHNAVALTNDKVLCVTPSWGKGNREVFYTSYLTFAGIINPTVLRHNLNTGKRDIVARYRGLNTGAAMGSNGWLAMVLSKGGSPDVYLAPPQYDFKGDQGGGKLVRVTATEEGESSPTWSPDSQWLCFATRTNGRRWLVKKRPNGGPMFRVDTKGIHNPSEPDWSPDGKWIAFTAPGGGFNICVVPANGGEARILVAGENPSWAPNSRTIIFTLRTGAGVNKRRLALLDVPTKRVKLVPLEGGAATSPAWAN